MILIGEVTLETSNDGESLEPLNGYSFKSANQESTPEPVEECGVITSIDYANGKRLLTIESAKLRFMTNGHYDYFDGVTVGQSVWFKLEFK